jgi:hypothetical protein
MRKPHIFVTTSVAVCLFLVLGYSTSVGALDGDEFFETVRGQLLQYYSSEILAHSGIILGLVIGSFALFAGWESFFGTKDAIGKNNHKKEENDKGNSNGSNVWIRRLAFFLLLGLALSLTLYSVGRLFYWSSLNADILVVQRKDTFDSSNATSLIGWLNHNVTVNFWNKAPSLELCLARAFYFDSRDWLPLTVFCGRMLYFILLPFVVWYPFQKIHAWNSKLKCRIVVGVLILVFIALLTIGFIVI